MGFRATFLASVFLVIVGSSTVAAEYVNVTEILERGGQYKKFLLYLWKTESGSQISDYLNKTNNLTLFAPTDSAFAKMEGGFFNGLNEGQQIGFVLYHFVPYFFTWENFKGSARNPVMTKAGGNYTLDFSFGEGQQVNISTGLVTVPIRYLLNSTFPLSVFSIETTLQHPDLFGKPESPPSSASPSDSAPASEETKKKNTPPPSSEEPAADASESSPEIDGKESASSFLMKATFWSTLMVVIVTLWGVSL